jgi:AbrB family looped-hinge helix DNA binding protein
MANVVGERFQITIDKRVRQELGIKPGDQAVERVEDGRLVVYFMPKPHTDSLLGIFKDPNRPARHVDMEAEKEATWAARAAEIVEALESDSRRHRRTEAGQKESA